MPESTEPTETDTKPAPKQRRRKSPVAKAATVHELRPRTTAAPPLPADLVEIMGALVGRDALGDDAFAVALADVSIAMPDDEVRVWLRGLQALNHQILRAINHQLREINGVVRESNDSE